MADSADLYSSFMVQICTVIHWEELWRGVRPTLPFLVLALLKGGLSALHPGNLYPSGELTKLQSGLVSALPRPSWTKCCKYMLRYTLTNLKWWLRRQLRRWSNKSWLVQGWNVFYAWPYRLVDAVHSHQLSICRTSTKTKMFGWWDVNFLLNFEWHERKHYNNYLSSH